MNTRLRDNGDIEILPDATERQSIDLLNAHEREAWTGSLHSMQMFVWFVLLVVGGLVGTAAGFFIALFGGHH
jgi:hypothetical protein